MEQSEGDIESALESALNGGEVVPKQVAAEPDAIDAVLSPPEEAPAEEAVSEPEQEPELEIDLGDGKVEIVRGEEKIREFVSKGLKAGRAFEEIARTREALAVQARIQQESFAFQQAVMGEIAQLRALDSQLEQWANVDWSSAFDADPFNAMKLKEQRDQLREMRNGKYQELNQRQQAFQQGQAQAAQQSRAAEEAALLAKLPEWRNSEKATTEKQAIWQSLAGAGFQDVEIQSVMDHRMLVVARKAMLYDQLIAGKDSKIKQVRDAPPVSKPGVQGQDKGKVGFLKFKQEIRKHGQQGNHRAQEDLVAAAFNSTFK